MSLPFFGKKKTATIVEHNQATNDVQRSAEIPTIGQANAISNADIAARGAIVISTEKNDFDGNETTFIEQSPTPFVWEQKMHIVLPTSEIDGDGTTT